MSRITEWPVRIRLSAWWWERRVEHGLAAQKLAQEERRTANPSALRE
jgi:hypothetical protein